MKKREKFIFTLDYTYNAIIQCYYITLGMVKIIVVECIITRVYKW